MDEIDQLNAKLLDLELDIRRSRSYLESLERKKARLQDELDDEIEHLRDMYDGCEPDCLL